MFYFYYFETTIVKKAFFMKLFDMLWLKELDRKLEFWTTFPTHFVKLFFYLFDI